MAPSHLPNNLGKGKRRAHRQHSKTLDLVDIGFDMVRIANDSAEQLVAAANSTDRAPFIQHALGKAIETSGSNEMQCLARVFRPGEKDCVQRPIRRLSKPDQLNIRLPGKRFKIREVGNDWDIDDPNDHEISSDVLQTWRSVPTERVFFRNIQILPVRQHSRTYHSRVLRHTSQSRLKKTHLAPEFVDHKCFQVAAIVLIQQGPCSYQ